MKQSNFDTNVKKLYLNVTIRVTNMRQNTRNQKKIYEMLWLQ